MIKKHLALAAVVVWALACPTIGGQSTQVGPVTTTGACSPVLIGNGEFKVTCPGLTKEQGTKMLELLNRIVSNQPNSDAISSKLDEILRILKSNPNRHLSEAQRKTIKELADSLPNPSPFLHIEIVNEPEALKYGNEIADFFREKTQTIGTGLSYPRGMPEGIAVTVDNEQDPLFPTAQRIAAALQQCGLPINFTHLARPTPGQIYIIVGVKPEQPVASP